MGMYTGLRAKVRVKPEYRQAIALLHALEPGRLDPATPIHCETDRTYGSVHRWDVVFARYPELPGLAGWVRYWRRDFIPFGWPDYMPRDFRLADEEVSRFDPETGVWEFACGLKNYEEEIGYFVEHVLGPICEAADYCERLYEEHPLDRDWREFVWSYLDDLSLPRLEKTDA